MSFNHRSVAKAARLVQRGEVIAFPTDTVYGIGASAGNEGAIERLYQIKRRDHTNPIPVLIGAVTDLGGLVTGLDADIEKVIDRFWPGALTLILTKKPGLPENLSPGSTLGVRLPDLDLTRALLQQSGPMAVSSANLSGQPSAVTAEELDPDLRREIALTLDGGRTPGGQASTVLDCTSRPWAVLRQGPVSLEDVKLALMQQDPPEQTT